MTIDAVITWVDGNDPILNAKRQKYGTSVDFASNDVAGATRFANIGEIFWCVASINRFAPWVNRIFIITDGQEPHLEEQLQKHFPEGFIPMEIVDHSVLFKGYEEYLPVFNSISIETMMWRIPNLSEHFIYFNDDFMLCAPVTPQDFFTDKGVLSRGKWQSMWWTKVLHFFKRKRNGRELMSFKWTMFLAAQMVGERKCYLKLDHTPHGLLKSAFVSLFEHREEWLIRNIRHRFRNPEQWSVIEMLYLVLHQQDKNIVLPVEGYLFYLFPKRKSNYVAKKMQKLQKGKYRCCCWNSLDLATPTDKAMVEGWIQRTLRLE